MDGIYFYSNIYDEVMKDGEKYRFLTDERYLEGTEEHDLGSGYTLRITTYRQTAVRGGTEHVLNAALCTLLKGGEPVLSYCQYGDSRTAQVARVVRHSSGRELFIFKENLYGLSVADLTDGRSVRYIPAGFRYDSSALRCDDMGAWGESLIVTGIHIHPDGDLLAVDGCYWAGPGEVYVFDFSDPFAYADKEYKSCHFQVRELFDSDYEEGANIDFTAWENGQLLCSGDGQTISVDIDYLRSCISERKNNDQ